jgi:MFS family permease
VGADRVAAAPRATPAPLRRNRDFTLLWTGQALSALGTQMSAVAYPLLVLLISGSAAQAGLVGSATLVGTLLALLPGGVVADHHPRKRIMVVTSLIQMAAGASVVPAVLTHHVYLAHLLAVGFILGTASAFYAGASRGATRRIVASEQLPEAMALTQARDRAATMLGPPAGGALFGVAPFLPFACDAASFGAIGLAGALLRTQVDPPRAGPVVRSPLRKNVTAGLRYVLNQPFLRMFAVWAAVINAVVTGVRLTVIVLAQRRGASAAEIGALFSVSAACGLAGALAAVRISRLLPGRFLVLTASWLFPACAVGMAFAGSVWLIAVLAGVTGFAIMPVNVILLARATLIIPDDMQAQAGNAMQLCWSGLTWLTPVAFGALTDALGPQAAMLTAAATYGLTAVWLQGNRVLTQVGDGGDGTSEDDDGEDDEDDDGAAVAAAG